MFYCYDENGLYTGSVAEEPTERYTKWKPMDPNPGFVAFFDGLGWQEVPDLQSTDRDLDQAKEILLSLSSRSFSKAPDQGKYGISESRTFEYQVQEAQQYLLDESVGPFLQALHDALGESISDLVTKILVKNEAYVSYLAEEGARAQKLRNQLDSITKHEEMPDILSILPYFA